MTRYGRRGGRCRIVAAAVLLGIGMPADAKARDSWSEDGVTLRLVAEHPQADGRFRAALFIDLDPDWKTYWLDPGDGGLPPKIVPGDSAAIRRIGLRFPAPHRTHDAEGSSNVFSAPFAVAIEGQRVSNDADDFAVKIALGICESVCVPVSAELDTAFPDRPGSVAGVDAAFASLPRRSTAAEGIASAAMAPDGKALLVTARLSTDAAPLDLFAAGPRGWAFGPSSVKPGDDGTLLFTLPVLAKPRKGPGVPDAVTAILTGPGGDWAADGLPVAQGD